jgi:hypothetical protein
MALALYLLNQKLYPIPYEGRRLLKIVAAGALIYGANLFLSSSHILGEFVLKSGLVVGFFLCLFFFRFFSSGELRAVSQELRKG